MKREREPNKGLLSPPGGKLNTDISEPPLKCAVREAFEECGLESQTSDWILIGIVTEKDYPGIGNIMMFLFEYKGVIDVLPDRSNEGSFYFMKYEDIMKADIPLTDKLYIWNFVYNRKKEVFHIYIDCSKEPFEFSEL